MTNESMMILIEMSSSLMTMRLWMNAHRILFERTFICTLEKTSSTRFISNQIRRFRVFVLIEHRLDDK